MENEKRRNEILQQIIELKIEYNKLLKQANEGSPFIVKTMNETIKYAQTQDR